MCILKMREISVYILLLLFLLLSFLPYIHTGTTNPSTLRTKASTSIDPYELAEIAYAFAEEHNLPEDAIVTLKRAVQYKKSMDKTTQVQLTYNLAYALQRNGNIQEAMTIFEEVGRQGISDGWVKAAQCAQEMGNIPKSIMYLQTSLSTTKEPNPQTFIYLGDMLNNLKRFTEAEHTYREGLGILRKYTQGRLDTHSKPIALALYHGLGDTLLNTKQYTEALEQYTTALRIEPTHTKLLSSAWMCSADLAWWKDWEDKTDQIIRITTAATAVITSSVGRKKMNENNPIENNDNNNEPSPLSPYEALFMDVSHELRANLSRSWSSRLMQQSRRAIWGPTYEAFLKEKYTRLRHNIYTKSRNSSIMRIGYVSRRFEDYPGTYLMLGMFKRHNRQRTQIYCYASGPDDSSKARALVESGCDYFTDISTLSPGLMMQHIEKDNLHTLIDYDGLHDFNNFGLLSLRSVVNQITFLGFAATSGNSIEEITEEGSKKHKHYELNGIDYNIVDRVTAPVEYVSQMFTEPVIYLRGSYQPQDPEQIIDGPLPILPNIRDDYTASKELFLTKEEEWKQFRRNIRQKFRLPTVVPLLTEDIMYNDENKVPFTGICNDIRIKFLSDDDTSIPTSIPSPLEGYHTVSLPSSPYQEPIIYTCFNRWHKIDPIMFTSWMNILARQPNSYLWLYGGGKDNNASDSSNNVPYTEYTNITFASMNNTLNAQNYCGNSKPKLTSIISSTSIAKLTDEEKEALHIRHLRFEANARGIHPSRIIFANKALRSTHLYRHYAADILLDTRIYGAHTTAADGLFTGLPVVTLLGKGFASRVGASLVTSVSTSYETNPNKNEPNKYRYPATSASCTMAYSHTEFENTGVSIGTKQERFMYLRYQQHAGVQAAIHRNTPKDTATNESDDYEGKPSLFDAQAFVQNWENGLRAALNVKLYDDGRYHRIIT